MTDEEATFKALAPIAERLGAEAVAERDREAALREDAETLLSAARKQAAQIVDYAETEACGMTAVADQAGKAAASLEQRAQWVAVAASDALRAEEAEAGVAALAAQRDQCVARVAELNGQLADLAAQRADAETQLEEARRRGDVDRITALRGRLDALADLAESVGAQRAEPQARIEAIGAGEFLPAERTQKELHRAQAAATGYRRSVRGALNLLFPDRPEAEIDRRRAEILGEMLPRPSDTARPPEPRTFVHP